jgi:PKD repeat protein
MSRWLALILVSASVLVVGIDQAGAVVAGAAPTWPVSNTLAAPPPIPTLPPATDAAPPADQIADPVTPAANCGGWEVQSAYAGRWPAGATWWQYRCTYDHSVYYNPCTAGACNAFCPECYWETETRADYFYWNGSDAVFYGEDYYYLFFYTERDEPGIEISAWWDSPTSRWYAVPTSGSGSPPPNVPPTASFTVTCAALTCTFDGSGSSDPDGAIWAGDYDWNFGDQSFAGGNSAQQHTYTQPGTYTVTLTVRDNAGATGSVSQTVTVEAPSPPPNVPPIPSFTTTCSGLTCSFDAGTSSDIDGTIASYSWSFGDGSAGSGANPIHSYGGSGTYSASLTVTDNAGASATVTKAVTATNLPPTAAFTVTCTALRCSLDASGSADGDGWITRFDWSFGDGSSGVGKTPTHDYPKAGSYTVTLTVTDNTGGTSVASQRINPISLSARGYKQSGRQKVDLSWNGPSGTSFDVYRNGARIATAPGTSYTDTVKGSGTYTYKVCTPTSSSCSNDAGVNF